MISAGMPAPAASKYKELENLQRVFDEAEGATTRAGNEFSNAKEVKEEAGNDLAYARREDETRRNEARAREQGIEAAEQKDRLFRNELRRLSDDIGVLYNTWMSSDEYARLLRWKYDRDFRNAVQLASLQIYCENRNEGGEALRSFHAASMKLSAAVAGVGSSAPIAYSPPRYFKVPEGIPQAPLAEEAAARDKARSVEAQREKLAKLEADTYPTDETARAKREHAKATSEAQKTAAALANAEKRDKERDAEFKKRRAAYTANQEEARRAQGAAREKELEIRGEQNRSTRRETT